MNVQKFRNFVITEFVKGGIHCISNLILFSKELHSFLLNRNLVMNGVSEITKHQQLETTTHTCTGEWCKHTSGQTSE